MCELRRVTSLESARSLIVEMLLLTDTHLNVSKVLHICSSVRFCLGP